MNFEIFTKFENSFYTFFITFLEKSKDHFCSPPAPKFALKWTFNFSICLYLPEQFLFLLQYWWPPFCLVTNYVMLNHSDRNSDRYILWKGKIPIAYCYDNLRLHANNTSSERIVEHSIVHLRRYVVLQPRNENLQASIAARVLDSWHLGGWLPLWGLTPLFTDLLCARRHGEASDRAMYAYLLRGGLPEAVLPQCSDAAWMVEPDWLLVLRVAMRLSWWGLTPRLGPGPVVTCLCCCLVFPVGVCFLVWVRFVFLSMIGARLVTSGLGLGPLWRNVPVKVIGAGPFQ